MLRLRANRLPHQCAVACCRRPPRPGRSFCYRHRQQRWREAHPVIAAWRGLIDRCRRKGRAFALSAQDFIDFLEETSYIDCRGRHRLCYHIDRKDNNLGYTRDNIQLLTCTENTAKGNRERHDPF